MFIVKLKVSPVQLSGLIVALNGLGFHDMAIVSVGDGAEIVERPAPKKNRIHTGVPVKPNRIYSPPSDTAPNVVAMRAVFEKIGKGKVFDLEQIKDLFKKAGKNPDSSTPLLSHFTKTGEVERVGTGRYKVK